MNYFPSYYTARSYACNPCAKDDYLCGALKLGCDIKEIPAVKSILGFGEGSPVTNTINSANPASLGPKVVNAVPGLAQTDQDITKCLFSGGNPLGCIPTWLWIGLGVGGAILLLLLVKR